MKINYNTNTIELTAKEMKAAQTYGSDMYLHLREVRNDFPSFRIVTSKAKSHSTLRITYNQMEKYILDNKNDDKTILNEFYTLRGLDENGTKKAFAETASYGEIKSWFVATFPEFQNLRSGIDEIMNEVKAKNAAKRVA